MGFFTWYVPGNLIFADKIFGQIYEIGSEQLAEGVPVEFVLSRIIDEDRGRLAARIHKVLLGSEPSLSHYQIQCPSGALKSLVSMGSCSTDSSGVPSHYSGAVVETNKKAEVEITSPLALQISEALQGARAQNHELAERYLMSALRSLHAGHSA